VCTFAFEASRVVDGGSTCGFPFVVGAEGLEPPTPSL
jgi:hypothetical protein